MKPRRCIDTDTIWTKIQTIAEKSNGFVKTSDIEAAGISRPMLKKYVGTKRKDNIFIWHRIVLLGDVGQGAEHLGYNAASRNEHQQVKA